VPFARAGDKVRIYYEVHGSGTPLVLAYGIGGNAEMWDVNRDALAARHRLVLWKPRGHARSGSPEDPAKYSFERWVLDLRAAVLEFLARCDRRVRS
jgi:pimeloyl-ACP methyl ester carboxylesterase